MPRLKSNPPPSRSNGFTCESIHVGIMFDGKEESIVSNEPKSAPTEGRVARRQRRNREALIRAAKAVLTEKGIDAATMLEIAERADVGAGTVYSYFKSKDELAIAVLEDIMQDLALRIQKATKTFEDP